MSIYALKPRFQALLRPLVRLIFSAGITANQVTVSACLISVILGLTLAWYPEPAFYLLIPFWMFLRMVFNAIDGMLARDFGQKSSLGAYLNELTDVISDACVYFPFAFLPHFSPPWVGVVIMLSICVEYAGCLGLMVGASRRYDGPFGKSDRAFVFGLLALGIGLGLPPQGWMAWVFPVMAILCGFTIIRRVRLGLYEAIQ